MSVAALAKELFGVEATAIALDGEHHLNARLDVAGVPRYLFKAYSPELEEQHLDLQCALLNHLGTVHAGVPTPSLVATATGTVRSQQRRVHLFDWLDGRVWSDAGEPDSGRLSSLGRAVARLDEALADFDHPGLDRAYRWNMLQAAELRRVLPRLEGRQRSFVAAALDRLDELMPALGELPAQAIHNDANENNILVGSNGEIAGLIDFGDAVRAPRVCGLAVALSYAQLGVSDPVAAALPVVVGYHAWSPLSAEELRLLPDLVDIRLAMSIANAAEQRTEDPDNSYLDISQARIRELIETLSHQPRQLLEARYRDACGYRAVAGEQHIMSWLRSAECDPAPMLHPDPRINATHAIDWTAEGPEELRMRHGATAVEAAIQKQADTAGGGMALGRYREDRVVYQSDAFSDPDGQRRSVHTAIDLFAAAGQPVFAPLDGVVTAVDYLPEERDYGGVLILEHRTSENTPFWVLVGHLSRESVLACTVGSRVERAETIAYVGDAAENGGWPPHIHVQLFTTLLGRSTDLPGAVRPDESDVWESVCPNPNVLLGAPIPTEAPHRPSAAAISARRQANLSPTLSLSYVEPLHIVAGEGAELIDASGGRHLDLVNNVCHVGHCHPRVVRALSEQAAVLNTNTRYLHSALTDYARKLAATFPDPLNVVMLTNSGSEANDLALRLARTATGRKSTLVLDWAYHGNLTSLIEVSPYKFNGRGGCGPGDDVRICALPDPYRGQFGNDGPRYVADVREQCAELAAGGNRPAAFLHESIPGCAGQVDLADGYLPAAYAAVRESGGVCVADEVQCGFGRVGTHMWAFERHGVVPDIVTLGKPIGNGHPIGAVVTTPWMARRFVTGMEYFNTFGGNPVSCAVGLAVLETVHEQRLMAHAASVGAEFQAGLRELATRHPVIGDVRGRGLFLGVDLVRDRDSREPDAETAGRVVEAAKASGVLLSTDGPADNVLKIKPPVVLEHEQARRAVDVLDRALAAS